MSFDKLLPFVISVVMGAAAAGKIDVLQRWIWRAQAQILHDSRASAWGSPRVFSQSLIENKNNQSNHRR